MYFPGPQLPPAGTNPRGISLLRHPRSFRHRLRARPQSALPEPELCSGHEAGKQSVTFPTYRVIFRVLFVELNRAACQTKHIRIGGGKYEVHALVRLSAPGRRPAPFANAERAAARIRSRAQLAAGACEAQEEPLWSDSD